MTECVDRDPMVELIAEAEQQAVRYDLDKAAMNERLKDPAAFAKFVKDIRPARLVAAGWEVFLSLRIFGDGERHWHCSAMLWPHGRCTTTADVVNLDSIMRLSGAPPEAKRYKVDEDVHRPHHWVWYEVDA